MAAHSLDSIGAAQQGLVRSSSGWKALVVGQRPLLERLVIALLAGGHVLIEGVPGLAKTRAVRALAQAPRPPVSPHPVHPRPAPGRPDRHADLPSRDRHLRRPPGPIVTSVLLADEINRAPAKVQSALLEAMQEGQITVGDETIVLPETFWVLATQNPIEHEGTYPLPEAQLDRFLMKLVVGYPDRASELTDARPAQRVRCHLAPTPTQHQRTASALRSRRRDRVPRAGRFDPDRPGHQGIHRRPGAGHPRPRRASVCRWRPLLELGASPRATIALVRAARGHALLAGRDFVTPHDVKSLARDIMRHRILVSFEADAEGLSPDDILQRILDHIPVP